MGLVFRVRWSIPYAIYPMAKPMAISHDTKIRMLTKTKRILLKYPELLTREK